MLVFTMRYIVLSLVDILRSKLEAKILGEKSYFTGKPCKNGHLSRRRVSTSHCIECAVQYKSMYYLKNRKELIRQTIEWQNNNPEKFKKKIRMYMYRAIRLNPEKFKIRRAEQYKKDPEKHRARSKRYWELNREKCIERSKQWKKNNPKLAAHRARIQSAIRRSRIKNGGTHTYSDIIWLFEKQHGLCFWCGVSVWNKFHVDHIIPLAKLGTNLAGNICISCPLCNQSKHATLPDVFLASRNRTGKIQKQVFAKPIPYTINPNLLCPSV